MSRQTGSNNFAGTLEILAGGPIDARLVVPTKADLTVSANFPYPYVGMIVSVIGEGKAYILTATPVTSESNWKELGSGGGDSGDGGTMLTGTLSASGWSNGSQTVTVTGVKSSSIGAIGILDTATSAQITAARNAVITPTAVSNNSITFTCENTPSIDIPFGALIGGGSSASSLPDGGTAGQVLTKKSSTDGDCDWEDAAGTAADISYLNTSSGMSATNVQGAIDELKTGIDNLPVVFTPAGSVAFASLPSLTAGNVGKVVNVTDAFTTTSNFVEGSGKSYPAGTNVAVIDAGSGSSHSYKYDAMSGFVDLSGKADKVSGATSGHLAALNSSGNLTDSGKALSDLQAKLTAGDGITINSSTNTISADVNYLIGAYDIYDSTERVVGYYDGKPLYKKSFTWTTALTNASGETIKTADIGASVDRIVFLKGTLQDSSSKWTEDMPFYKNEAGTQVRIAACAWPNSSSTSNKNKVAVFYYGDCTWCSWQSITIYYTKTTDSTSSVSYGHENQYSTSEQIVGTWIDGKPLYQKTVSVGPLPNASIKNIAHGISNFRNMVSATAYAYNSSAGYSLPMPYNATYALSSVPQPICYFYVDSSKIYVTSSDYDLSSYTEAYVTLQYTKTT